MTDKIKHTAWICILMISVFCSCNSNDDMQQPIPEGTVSVRLMTAGMSDGQASNAESAVNEVQGFRFEEGILEEIFDRLNPNNEGICRLQPLQMRGTVYFLANATDIIQKYSLQAGKTTLEEFLEMQADTDELTASGMVMTGHLELDRTTVSATAILKRSISRIDLDASFAEVEVNSLRIKNIIPAGYVNEQSRLHSPAGIETVDLTQDFNDSPFQNRKETLFYVCEQGNGPHEVELTVTIGGAWHRLKTSLPAIKRNTIYTLKVYGNGADIRIEVLTDDWENGSASTSEQELKSLIDKNASQLAEGVEINERGDTVFIPYQESDLQLALSAEENATRLEINGTVDGVHVTQQTITRGMQQFARVDIHSPHKMPGSKQEYIYLDVYKGSICTGRIVLVFRPNPIELTGKIRFDGNAVCDFNGYVDGELGILTLPEGKILETEIVGTAPWIKTETTETAGCYRIIAGWKPNDPDADGRIQEVRLHITDTNGNHRETYTIKRQNWGLPVVNVNGTWWCKYNLSGNVKDFTDQILVKDDPVNGSTTVFEYLKTCSDKDLLKIMGDQYQAGNPEGLKLTHEADTLFYYNGYQNTSGNFGTMDPTAMAPDGYQIPDYDDFRFFAWNNNSNLKYDPWGVFNNNLGQRLNYSVAERTLIVDGVPYGTIGLYDFVYENTHWAIFGLGHQWGDKSISKMMVLFATYGHTSNTWLMEGYPQSDGRGNWFKYAGNNASKTRTIRCIKTPVEYIYE